MVMMHPAGVYTIYTVHAILVLRLYGLYGNKRMVYGLLFLLFCSLAVEIYVAAKLLPHFHVESIPSLGPVCVGEPGNKFALIWCEDEFYHCERRQLRFRSGYLSWCSTHVRSVRRSTKGSNNSAAASWEPLL